MKIAICLHGQPRNYLSGYNSLKFYLNNYDTDVYIHTWWDKSKIGEIYDSAPWVKKENHKIEENIDKDLITLYKPKNILIDPPRKFIPKREYDVGSDKPMDVMFNNISSRMYSLQKVLSLVENKDDYDIFIITRFDLVIYSMPRLDDLDQSKIYTNTGHEDRLIYNDFQWILGNKNIDVFTSIYDDIDMIYDRMNNLTDYHKKLVRYNKEICEGQEGRMSRLGAEEIFSYNFVFKGVINNVIKDPRIKTNVKR